MGIWMNADRHQQGESAVRREYDRLAERYDKRWRAYIDASLNMLLDDLELEGDERIIDIACGTGELAWQMLEKWPNLDIVGVDISPKMLGQARAKDAKRRVEWVEAAVAELPFAENEFDCVLCANSFHCFSEPEKALLEFRRVVRPDGQLVLVDWCDDYLSCKLCSLWLRWTDPAFFRTHSLRACRRFATQAGMHVVAAERFRVSWLWGMMRLVSRPVDD
jgi:ubiquinone/menaquinone biosynthesis C-methylase UbiE